MVVVQRPTGVKPMADGVKLPGPRVAAAAGPASGSEPDLASATPGSQGSRPWWPQIDPEISHLLRPPGDTTTLQYGQHVLLPRLTERKPIKRQ